MTKQAETNPLLKWREGYERKGRQCRALEIIAMGLRFPVGFEVREWPGLDWVKHGYNVELGDSETNSIPAFRRMVEATAEVLGTPDSVDSQHWLGSYGDSAPDLVAKWKVPTEKTDDWPWEHVEVTVRMLSPKGCMIKPGTEFIEKTEPELHPECTYALKELEELGAV